MNIKDYEKQLKPYEGCNKCPAHKEYEKIHNIPLNWDLEEKSNYSEPEYTGNDWLNDKWNSWK